MRFNFFACALLATSVVADSNQTVADITVINNGLAILDKAIKQMTVGGVRGLPYGLNVQQIAVALDKNITIGTKNAQASAPYGTLGSISVAGAITGLVPNTSTALNDLKSAQQYFGEYSPLVLASLYQLKRDTDAFATAVIAKLDTVEAALGPSITSYIDSQFNSAITQYGGKSKFIVPSSLQLR